MTLYKYLLLREPTPQGSDVAVIPAWPNFRATFGDGVVRAEGDVISGYQYVVEVVAPSAGGSGALSTSFAGTTLDSSVFPVVAGGVVVNNSLFITSRDNTFKPFGSYVATPLRTLVSRTATVKIVTKPPAAGGSSEFGFMSSDDGFNALAFVWNGASGFALRRTLNGNTTFSPVWTPNSSAHNYVRFRHNGTTLFMEVSSDGTTWAAAPSALPAGTNPPLDSGRFYMQATHFGTNPPFTVEFDSFNYA